MKKFLISNKKLFQCLTCFIIFIAVILISINNKHNYSISKADFLESNVVVTYSQLTSKLNTFYNNLNNPEFYFTETNKFLCTGENITCGSSGTYNNIGLLNIDEYTSVGGLSSYLEARNPYWTMTEDETSAYCINPSGQELILKTGTSGIKPALYTKGTINVTGSGTDSDPFIFVTVKEAYEDESGVNPPELASNMIPVRWNGSKWVKADTSKKWYDYGSQQWANAVLVKASGTKTRQYYKSTLAIGKEVNEEDILAYFVWIPRYAYKIATCYHNGCSGSGGVVSIKFLTGETNTTPDETAIYTDNSSNTHFVKHPAFTFGTEELTGIWVGKFEFTGSIGNITTKPSINSFTQYSISSFFNWIRSMENTGNVYGLISSEIDSHIVKNIEWGAAAYLTQSAYGKYGNTLYSGENKEVWNNTNSSTITGCAGAAKNETQSSTCLYFYNSSNGQQASTTGNVYGIYDMSGGRDEYVMGYLSGYPGSSGFSTMPDSKYYDEYTAYNNSKYGDAVYEVSLSSSGLNSWYTESSDFITSSSPWFRRGGNSSSGAGAGIFFYSNLNGAGSGISSRIVLVNE